MNVIRFLPLILISIGISPSLQGAEPQPRDLTTQEKKVLSKQVPLEKERKDEHAQETFPVENEGLGKKAYYSILKVADWCKTTQRALEYSLFKTRSFLGPLMGLGISWKTYQLLTEGKGGITPDTIYFDEGLRSLSVGLSIARIIQLY